MIYLLPEDDFQLQSRESIKKGSKTQQQIKKYTIDEDLGEAKRTILLLSKGQPIQRKAVIQSLSKTTKQIPSIINSLLPIIKQILPSLDLQLQNSLVGQIIELVPALDDSNLKDLTKMCLVQIEDWKNQKLSLQWLKLFGILVKTEVFSEFQQQALQISLKLSQGKEILPMRMIAVRMIGHLSFNRLKGTPLDRIRAFCRDPDIQMRVILVKEVMPLLFQNLGVELINIYFMERMFQMIYDSELEIKITAIDLFLENYNILSNQDKERFSKIIMEHLEDQSYSEQLSLKIGLIYEKIRFQLERRSEMGSLINCFVSFINSEEARVRYNALYNLPGLLFYMGLKIWSDVKKSYFQILVKEEETDVKKLAITILPQILKIMELTEFEEFPVSTLNLIKSLNIQIEDTLMCFLEGFPILFEAFKRSSLQLQCYQKDNSSIQKIIKNIQLFLLGILKALIKKDQKQLKNHYLLMKFHTSIGQCIKYMNTQTLIDIYFPLLYSGLEDSNGITIQPLLQCTCLLFYQLVSKVEILPLVHQINKLLYESNSLFRLKYIKLCTKLLSYFSIQKYKELQFYDRCIKLIDSPDLAIRLQLVIYLQEARGYVMQDIDQNLNKLFESKQVLEYTKLEEKIVTQQQKQQKKRRNSQCLKNQQIQYLLSSKKKIQDQQRKKKNFIIKPGPLAYKKNLLKNMGIKNLTSSSTSSHSLVPSFATTNRSDLKNKVVEEIKEVSKSIRKIISNKGGTEQEKQQVEKRKFQSVEISLQKNKISDRRRRKTIFEKKEGAV